MSNPHNEINKQTVAKIRVGHQVSEQHVSKRHGLAQSYLIAKSITCYSVLFNFISVIKMTGTQKREVFSQSQ